MGLTKEEREQQQNDYKIEFVDRILDPVHGFIDLTQVEKEIIELRNDVAAENFGKEFDELVPRLAQCYLHTAILVEH